MGFQNLPNLQLFVDRVNNTDISKHVDGKAVMLTDKVILPQLTGYLQIFLAPNCFFNGLVCL